MKVRLEAGRLLLYHLGWSMTQSTSNPMESAMVKLFLSESFVQSSLDTIQVHGGFGYMVESGIERELRDAIAGPDLLGDVRHPEEPDRPTHAVVMARPPPRSPRETPLPTHPDRPAVVDRDRTLRTPSWTSETNRLAHLLIDKASVPATGSGSTSTSHSRPSSASTRSQGRRRLRAARFPCPSPPLGLHRRRLRHPPPHHGVREAEGLAGLIAEGAPSTT